MNSPKAIGGRETLIYSVWQGARVCRNKSGLFTLLASSTTPERRVETLSYSVWRRYIPKADGSRERSEPWSDKAGRRRLCCRSILPAAGAEIRNAHLFRLARRDVFFEERAGLFCPAPLQKKQATPPNGINECFPSRVGRPGTHPALPGSPASWGPYLPAPPCPLPAHSPCLPVLRQRVRFVPPK